MVESRATLRQAAPLLSAHLLCAFGFIAQPAFGQATSPPAAADESSSISPGGSASSGTASTKSSEPTPSETAPSDVQTPESEQAPPEEKAADGEESDSGLDVSELDSRERPPSPDAEPAIIDTPGAHLEDEDDWLKWPFSKKNQSYPRQTEPHRWGGAGAFVGWVHRPSQSDSIKYQPGVAWGGYIRAELLSWLGLRLFYREERIPVQVQHGAFDYGEDVYDDDFEQPDMEMLNLGARLEPTLVVHPRVRVRGIFGWSWLWFRAPYPKSADFELQRTFRSAVQMDFSFGAGLSLDIVENWIDISLDSAYSVPAGRTGTVYQPAQIVRDGGIKHIAEMPMLQNSLDCLISLGVIL